VRLLFRLFHERYYRPAGKCLHGQEVIDETVATRRDADLAYRPRDAGL
jgi:hypothetical protein